MELRDILKTLSKYKNTIVITTIMGALVGLISYYLLPTKYTAVGSFYIKRATESTGIKTYFTYEGYYAQQGALSYTNTVVALLESLDIRNKALQKLNLAVNEESLRKYGKLINVRKMGPQLITLTTEGNIDTEAKTLWNALSDTLLETTAEVNKDGDPKLSISKVAEEPVVKTTYKALWLNTLIGAGTMFSLSIFWVSFREYFKTEN